MGPWRPDQKKERWGHYICTNINNETFFNCKEELRGSHPRVTQPWYADDARAGGNFPNIVEHLSDLQVRGPARGYYPEPTKSVLVVDPGNVAREEEHFRGLGIKVVTWYRYLGGYIGYKEAEGRWLAGKIKGWT